jgi:oxygen-independent coproporphyrinogen-3 oxidase
VIRRRWKRRHPNDYLAGVEEPLCLLQGERLLQADDLVIEFMMNVLRLSEGVESALFNATTGLAIDFIQAPLRVAIEKGLLQPISGRLCPTALGFRFLNDLIAVFEVNKLT